MRHPDLFVVGAPKCGTTALYTYLRRHPEVFMSPLKEAHFFGTDLRFVDRPPLSEREYLGYFAGARNERCVGEASVWYLYSTRAALEIKRFSAAARIVVMLRNPVDLMYALHAERVVQGSEPIREFAAALRAEPRRRQGLDPPRRGLVDAGLYRAVAHYPDQLMRYFETFGRERVHVIVFDDLVADAAAVYAATARFLGVTPRPVAGLRPENPSRRIRSAWLARAFHDPPRVVRVLGRAALSRPARTRLLAALRRLNSRVAPRPPMPEALRRELQAEFRPDIVRLGRMLDRDLAHWADAEALAPRR
ncbi:MAG TPA: sulfotransferase domain-containing protein [Methylomirabilota bacterium]|nr:sulfotransferase domain-containing protein [Methylomirabilota bacterium]